MGVGYCDCAEPVADSLFAVVAEGGDEYWLTRCRNCELVWDTPMPDEEALQKAYSADYYTAVDVKFNPLIEAWTRFSGRRRARRLLRQHGGSRSELSVLDVGCGRGVLLQGFRESGVTVLGVERPGSGFERISGIETCSLEELVDQGRKFQVIVLWHVLEHLPAPQRTLDTLQQLLSDDGSLFVEVPNFGSLQARLFRSHWFHLDLPRHLFHYTRPALTAQLRRSGFIVQRVGTLALDQNLYGFLQSALNCLPLLPANHLYGLLKQGFSARVVAGLLLYLPALAVLAVPALLDTMLASALGLGGVLSVQARKAQRDSRTHD